jgi:hypothetical protein
MKTYKIVRLVVACSFSMMLLVGIRLYANPIPVPPTEFAVSELMFDIEKKWVMELRGINIYGYYSLQDIDSVCITSSGGRGRVKMNCLDYGNDFVSEMILLGNDCLDSDLIINQTGDFIQVTTYYERVDYIGSVDSVNHTLIFGNYTGATVRSPNENESIVFISGNLYSIDKTPTIGLPNDEEGTHTTILFEIYYPDEQLFVAPVVKLCNDNDPAEIILTRQADGLYSGEAHLCSYYFTKMHFKTQESKQYHSGYWYFRTWRLYMNWWDAPNYAHLIILDQFQGIQSVQIEKTILKIYPNPVKEKVFGYQTELPVKSAISYLEITGIDGQMIEQYSITENKGRLMLPSNIVAGIYTVRLIVNKKNYATTKIIIQ